ncbi:hypothetical protein ABT084_34840 [Streptomyces sp. NPDC002138]|uniref:hypothetical protein n=1 Tax=Streptomyces sp. NPDC002138 TaxID=3154410 RepID=UPI003317C516
MRSALALRTSLVTAAVAGTLLAPAATSAFAAATAPQTAVSAVSAAGTASDDSRYEGKPVYIGEGLVAVLRNGAEGPEAWIRFVGTAWKPGDNYMVRVVEKLDRTHTSATVGSLQLKLTHSDQAVPLLTVTVNGTTASYPLPKGKAVPAEPTDPCVSEVKQVQVGGYRFADLTMSPQGPKAYVHSTDPQADPWSITLTRTSPTGTRAYYLHIANPSGAAPVMEWKTQGGDSPVYKSSFPALPKGCKAAYEVHDDATPKPAPATTPAATPKPVTPSNVSTQTKGQTTVVPQGAVAAGAEIPVATVADTDDTTTLAVGAGLLALFAALGTVALRRRSQG